VFGRRLRFDTPLTGRNVEAHRFGLPGLSASSPIIPTDPYSTSPPSRLIAPPAFGRRLRSVTVEIGRNDEPQTAGEPALSGSTPITVADENCSSDCADSCRSFAPETTRLPRQLTSHHLK